MSERNAVEVYLRHAAEESVRRVLQRVQPWVEQETPSGDEEAIARLSRAIEPQLQALGATTHGEDAPGLGRNLRADFAGSTPDLAPLVALAHIDTVHPRGTLDSQPFRVVDGRAEGPGIYDMKTGLALIVEALAWLHEQGRGPRRPVRLLITCDEEIGSHSARALFAQAALGAHAALVPEPCLPDGSIKTSRKGVSTYELDVHGRAAHAGVEPDRAVSVARELIQLLPAIYALEDRAAGTQMNVGVIQAGTASNVVPAHARLWLDVRVADAAEGDRVRLGLDSLRPAHPEARLEVRQTETRGPLVRTSAIEGLYIQARDIAAGLGTMLGEGGTGGGSDGSLIAGYGIAVLDGIGPRGGGAHASDEHIQLDDIPFRLAFMARLLESL